jgi:hypothetical protein
MAATRTLRSGSPRSPSAGRRSSRAGRPSSSAAARSRGCTPGSGGARRARPRTPRSRGRGGDSSSSRSRRRRRRGPRPTTGPPAAARSPPPSTRPRRCRTRAPREQSHHLAHDAEAQAVHCVVQAVIVVPAGARRSRTRARSMQEEHRRGERDRLAHLRDPQPSTCQSRERPTARSHCRRRASAASRDIAGSKRRSDRQLAATSPSRTRSRPRGRRGTRPPAPWSR